MSYITLLSFWFPKDDLNTIPKFWFDKNPDTDKYIKDNFYNLLKLAENHKLNFWKTNYKGHLALIILLDQFSRHIYRDSIEVYKNDIIALNYAREFFLENRDKDLTILEKIMALMPFRHDETIESYEFVLNYIKNDPTNIDPLWDKFKLHTNLKYDQIKKGIVHDKYSLYGIEFSKILEYSWFKCENKPVSSNITDTLKEYLKNNYKYNNLIIVSLSGGVDSMVILYNLAKLNLCKVVAVHLDYHNRDETGLEAEFLFRFCEVLKIPLYYRYIYEGSRKESDREEYENLTKEIRFNTYKKVQNLYPEYNHLGVVLGHHKGDLQENVFFNLMKGRSLTDLSVIKESSEIMGVKILRLLIKHPKKDIFDFAIKYNIPYFKNTTPSWSNRGKYREIIEPAIIDTFGIGVLNNLSKISNESDELQLIIKSNIIDPYFKTIKVIDNIHYLPITPNQPITYWKYILQEWCHRNKFSQINYRLLSILYNKIYSTYKISICCSEKLKIIIDNNTLICKIEN